MAKKPVISDDAGDEVQMVIVRATAKGYFGRVIEPDQGENSEFEVPKGTKGSWFELVNPDDGDVI